MLLEGQQLAGHALDLFSFLCAQLGAGPGENVKDRQFLVCQFLSDSALLLLGQLLCELDQFLIALLDIPGSLVVRGDQPLVLFLEVQPRGVQSHHLAQLGVHHAAQFLEECAFALA